MQQQATKAVVVVLVAVAVDDFVAVVDVLVAVVVDVVPVLVVVAVAEIVLLELK